MRYKYCELHFLLYTIMRTNIVIDHDLMADALKFGGCSTKREAVEEALKMLVKIKKLERLKDYRGKLPWDGDLESMRLDN